MDEAFLILDMAESGNWVNGPAQHSLVRIPPEKRPTVVQSTRGEAEREVLRLQAAHPSGRFVLFQATHATVLMDAPTHVNLAGKTLFSRPVARLVQIDNPNEVPF